MRTFSGGFLRPAKNRGSVIPMYWGDGSDGVLSEGDTYIAGTGQEADYEKYSDFCIKQFTSINWVPGSPETLTVDEPCRGLILFVDGNVTIGENATISMAKMGSVMPANPSELIDLYGDSAQMRHIVNTLKTLRGGTGGDGGPKREYSGNGGTGGIGRICQGGIGGGGGGGTNYHGSYLGQNGGSVVYPEMLPGPGGNPVKGGVNGGGGGCNYNSVEIMDLDGGGNAFGAGGGGATADRGTRAGDGEHTGGFILIIAKGSVSIAGILDVTGGKGGNAGTGCSYRGTGGGGSGGGVAAVFARGAIDTTAAVKTLTGGAGGSGASSGTAGGDGTYYEEQL